jgi:hypothetical protein
MREIPEYGEHMLLEEFVRSVKSNFFIDYDGFGKLATATEMSEEIVYPSNLMKLDFKFPDWVTHVVWFNR